MKASCTPCEKSETVSFSGNRVALMRRRISASASSDTSTRNGRIAAFSTGFTSAATTNGVSSDPVAVTLATAGGTRLAALSGDVDAVSGMVILQDEGGGKATNRQ